MIIKPTQFLVLGHDDSVPPTLGTCILPKQKNIYLLVLLERNLPIAESSGRGKTAAFSYSCLAGDECFPSKIKICYLLGDAYSNAKACRGEDTYIITTCYLSSLQTKGLVMP